MGGDGCIVYTSGQQPNHSYHTTSKKLADDVQELLFKLGYNSSISMSWSKDHYLNRNGKRVLVHSNYPKYSVYRRVSKESSVWPKRHISVEEYNDYVYCATVEPYHTLVVRRNGVPSICGNSWWNTIVHTNGKEKTGYPTQKPLKILERIVKVHSMPGDLTMDFFAGSGSFGYAADMHGRNCVLIDQNPIAIEIMRKRFSSVENVTCREG